MQGGQGNSIALMISLQSDNRKRLVFGIASWHT